MLFRRFQCFLVFVQVVEAASAAVGLCGGFSPASPATTRFHAKPWLSNRWFRNFLGEMINQDQGSILANLDFRFRRRFCVFRQNWRYVWVVAIFTFHIGFWFVNEKFKRGEKNPWKTGLAPGGLAIFLQYQSSFCKKRCQPLGKGPRFSRICVA